MNHPSGVFQQSEHDVTAALEHRPAVPIPLDFAARTAKRAAVMPAVRRRSSVSYGRVAATVAAGMLVVAMFVLAAQAKASFTSLAFDLELLLVVQLVGIAWWLTVSATNDRS